MITLLDQFAANLGEAEDAVTAIVGDSVYVRYANDPAVLKITTRPGVDEVKITFQLIHPEHGPIDAASFTLTRAQKFDFALEQLEVYQDIWFA
ncbi:hypothetical protein [Streptomyces canus]|uniref:hypothetical protein n=1 Tax=Streptomyces canus TaxID=58343 RepID=UPI0022555200|nr:hypothetical protein [Streptomyces canus]MCX4858297.1 hypothetical protein [Streptomyces canus]